MACSLFLTGGPLRLWWLRGGHSTCSIVGVSSLSICSILCVLEGNVNKGYPGPCRQLADQPGNTSEPVICCPQTGYLEYKQSLTVLFCSFWSLRYFRRPNTINVAVMLKNSSVLLTSQLCFTSTSTLSSVADKYEVLFCDGYAKILRGCKIAKATEEDLKNMQVYFHQFVHKCFGYHYLLLFL